MNRDLFNTLDAEREYAKLLYREVRLYDRAPAALAVYEAILRLVDQEVEVRGRELDFKLQTAEILRNRAARAAYRNTLRLLAGVQVTLEDLAKL